MTSQKLDQEKKDLVILDFDGTIFENSRRNFNLQISLDDIIDAHTFFSEYVYQTGNPISKNAEFILLTGRHISHQPLIVSYLETKKYKFTRYYFNQMSFTSDLDEFSFLIKYWTAKVELINQLRLTNDFNSIVVLDDDKILCAMLGKLNFEVYQAEITKDTLTHTLSITFTPPQKRSMSELQNILKPAQKQRERVMELV